MPLYSCMFVKWSKDVDKKAKVWARADGSRCQRGEDTASQYVGTGGSSGCPPPASAHISYWTGLSSYKFISVTVQVYYFQVEQLALYHNINDSLPRTVILNFKYYIILHIWLWNVVSFLNKVA